MSYSVRGFVALRSGFRFSGRAPRDSIGLWVDRCGSTIPARSCWTSSGLHAVPVVRRQHQHLVIPPAQDDIEVVEDVAAQDAQIGCGGVREGGELAADSSRCSVLAREFEDDVDQYEFVGASLSPGGPGRNLAC